MRTIDASDIKRHLAVDTQGFCLEVALPTAEVTERKGALKGYLPMRYPAQSDALGDHLERDALLLGCERLWQKVGRTGGPARG